jgi:DNA-dependent RNA polymerase auxiliary subunit epsilon
MYRANQEMFGVPAERNKRMAAQQRAVFGSERLAVPESQRASELTVKRFVNKVLELCAEPPSMEMGADLRIRNFGSDDRRTLTLSSNTALIPHFYPDPKFDGLASASYLKADRKFNKNLALPIGSYLVSDSIYIEADSQRPVLHRELLRDNRFSRGYLIPVEGKLTATETEVREAIEIIENTVIEFAPTAEAAAL